MLALWATILVQIVAMPLQSTTWQYIRQTTVMQQQSGFKLTHSVPEPLHLHPSLATLSKLRSGAAGAPIGTARRPSK